MSKCGNCDLYDETQCGIYCAGNLGDEECARKLQEYIRAQQMEWISVNDKLPEDLPENKERKVIPCIVALKSCYPNGKATVQKRQRQWRTDCDGRFSEWEWSRIGAQRVTHWMPLPEPPKGGATDGQ